MVKILYPILSLTYLASLLLPTGVSAQPHHAQIDEQTFDACGGIRFPDLLLRLIFSEYPDQLATALTQLTQLSATKSDILGDNDTLSVLSTLGTKTQCQYVSRYPSCYHDGYERLSSAIPFFTPINSPDLSLTNLLAKQKADLLSSIEFTYISTNNKDGSVTFSGVEASDLIPVTGIYGVGAGDYIKLGDALRYQSVSADFYCVIASLSDDELIDREPEIIDYLTDLTSTNQTTSEPKTAPAITIDDQLQLSYELTIVDSEGQQSGFWTLPENNTAAENFYIVVEAIGADGESVYVPITNEETGDNELVNKWGQLVPEATYRSVESDKNDDGKIQNNLVGVKESGSMTVDYLMPVLGGVLTRW